MDLHSPDRNRAKGRGSISDCKHKPRRTRAGGAAHNLNLPLSLEPAGASSYLRRPASARGELPASSLPLPPAADTHIPLLTQDPHRPDPIAQMCHRQLRLWKATQCGHLTFSGETNVDCGQSDCRQSTAHPQDCGKPGSGIVCRCKRYYRSVLPFFSSRPPAADPPCPPPSQPERIVTDEVSLGNPSLLSLPCLILNPSCPGRHKMCALLIVPSLNENQ